MTGDCFREFSSEDIRDGTVEKWLKLSRLEDSRVRQLYKRDTLSRTLDIAQSILLFLPEIFWRIVLMPILILIDEIKIAIKGE